MSTTLVRRVLPLLLVACGTPAASVAPITVAAPSAAPRVASRGTLLGGCVIEGNGERPRPRRYESDEEVPFYLYPSADAHEPELAVTAPEVAHVVWSRFPTPGSDMRAPRPRVELAGQGIRYGAWADLGGRTFTTTRKMESEHGHVFARAGAPVEIVSARDDGVVFVRVTTSFAAPSSVVVEGSCADLRYQPDAPAMPAPRPSRTPATNRKAIRLFLDADAARPFTTIDATPESLDLDALERRGDRVHVTLDAQVVGFDAWVLASEIADHPPTAFPRALPPAAPAPRDASFAQRARVLHDAPIFVGDSPTPLEGATLEANAEVAWDPTSEVQADGRALVVFELASGLVASTHERMWTTKDALQR